MKASAQIKTSADCDHNKRDENMRRFTSIFDIIDAKASIPGLMSELAFGSAPSGPTAAALSNAYAVAATPRRPILR